MSVKLIRMVSGEEVLAEMTTPLPMESDDPVDLQFSHISVKNPAILIPAGQGKLALVPWLPYAKTDGMKIATKAVAFVVDPNKDLSNEYNKMFGSGLVLPTGPEPAGHRLSLVGD